VQRFANVPLDCPPRRLIDVVELLPILEVDCAMTVHRSARTPASSQRRRRHHARQPFGDAIAKRGRAATDGVERQVLSVAASISAPYRDDDERKYKEDDEGDDGRDEERLRLGQQQDTWGEAGLTWPRSKVERRLTLITAQELSIAASCCGMSPGMRQTKFYGILSIACRGHPKTTFQARAEMGGAAARCNSECG
jgi:hypothetical protein